MDIIKFELLENIPDIIHGFSSRAIDLPGLCNKLDIPFQDIVQAEQVHGHIVKKVTSSQKGKTLSHCDGLITNQPGIALVIRTADCLPIYIYDPETKSIGLIHAGWKGTLNKIITNACNLLKNDFGSSLSKTVAVIGPGICRKCYQVGNEVIDALNKTIKNSDQYLDHHCLDLKKINFDLLVEAGISKKNILVSSDCTACLNQIYYSYRKEGKGCGRLYALLAIK